MAATFGTIVNVTPGTGANTGASPSITTPVTNPVVIVSISLDSLTATVSSLTITGFGGTASEVLNVRGDAGGNAFTSVWKIVAPAANTAGTVQGNLSASVPFQMTVKTFSGAHQTDPSPIADAVSDGTSGSSVVLTPANLTANDATHGSAGNTNNNPTGINPNQRFINGTTTINHQDGDNTGTTGVTVTHDAASTHARVAVRVVAAAGGVTIEYVAPAAMSAGGKMIGLRYV